MSDIVEIIELIGIVVILGGGWMGYKQGLKRGIYRELL